MTIFSMEISDNTFPYLVIVMENKRGNSLNLIEIWKNCGQFVWSLF